MDALFAAQIGALLIFALRVVDVTMGTFRVILMTEGIGHWRRVSSASAKPDSRLAKGLRTAFVPASANRYPSRSTEYG